MSSISSDEIISILKNEIENFDQISKDSEVGTVVSVGDGIANIYGIEHAMYGKVWFRTFRKIRSAASCSDQM